MQSSVEGRPGNGRPSLLTEAQQAEADRNRILSRLEGDSDTAATRSRRGIAGRERPWRRVAICALLLTVAGAVWLAMQGTKASGDSGAAKPAVGSAPPSAVAQAATIHDEAPPSVEAVLAGSPAGQGAAKDEAPAAAAAPAAVAPVASETHAVHAHKPASQVVHAPVPAHKTVVHVTAPDRDVELLSAFVAHSEAARTRDREKDGVNAAWRSCGQGAAKDVPSCRAHVCAGKAARAQCAMLEKAPVETTDDE